MRVTQGRTKNSLVVITKCLAVINGKMNAKKMGVNEQESMQKQVKTITPQSPWYLTHFVSFTTYLGPIASTVQIIIHCRQKKTAQLMNASQNCRTIKPTENIQVSKT
jgi:hypothetical protein